MKESISRSTAQDRLIDSYCIYIQTRTNEQLSKMMGNIVDVIDNGE